MKKTCCKLICGFIVFSVFVLSGCTRNDLYSLLASPGPVTLTRQLTKGPSSITVNWTNSDDDIAYVLVDWGSSNAGAPYADCSYTITGLSPLTTYTITLNTVGDSGYESLKSRVLTVTTSATGDSAVTGLAVSSRSELEAMADDLTGTYILIADIDLSASEWTPIGSYAASTPFTGTFDGGGHSISNMSITAEENNKGFFAYTDGAALQYSDFSDVFFTASYGNRGAAVGNAQNSTLKYLTSSGTVNGISGLGGIAGSCSSCTVSNCSSSVTVNATSTSGGLVGAASSSTISSCSSTGDVIGTIQHIGGLIGYAAYTTVEFCHATGSVTGGVNTGGLVGYLRYDGSSASYCYATGDVSGTGVDGNGWSNAGGLVGFAELGDVFYSYATGNVSSTAGGNIGGLVGYLRGDSAYQYQYGLVENCYARGNVNGNTFSRVGGLVGYEYVYPAVLNCYSTGTVTGSGSYVYGFVGDNSTGRVTDCVFDSSLAGQPDLDATGAPATTLQIVETFTRISDGYVAAAWDFAGTLNDDGNTSDYWAIDSSINDGYPYLLGLEP